MVDMTNPKILPTEANLKKWEEKYGKEEAKEMLNLAYTLAGMSEEDMITSLRFMAHSLMQKENTNEI